MKLQTLLSTLLCITTLNANILSIDIGTSYIKYSLLRVGYNDILLNTNSKRKTLAILTVHNQQKWIGSEAFSKCIKYPTECIIGVKRFVGTESSDNISVEQVLAMFIDYGIKLANVDGLLVYLSIPYFYSHTQKQVYMNACSIVSRELQCYLIEESVALALQYSTTYDYQRLLLKSSEPNTNTNTNTNNTNTNTNPNNTNTSNTNTNNTNTNTNPNNTNTNNTNNTNTNNIDTNTNNKDSDNSKHSKVMLIDVGHYYTTCTLALYSTQLRSTQLRSTQKYNSNDYIESVQILYTSNARVGAVDIDTLLIDKVYKHTFNTTNPSTLIKYKREASRVKEILSANTQVHSYIEGIEELSVLVDKSVIEDNSSHITTTITSVFTECLSNTSIHEIESVVLVGGGVRIPFIQHLLLNLSNNKLAYHLNGDESIVFGSMFRGAQLSGRFRVAKSIELVKVWMYDVVVVDGRVRTVLFNRYDIVTTREYSVVNRVIVIEYGSDRMSISVDEAVVISVTLENTLPLITTTTNNTNVSITVDTLTTLSSNQLDSAHSHLISLNNYQHTQQLLLSAKNSLESFVYSFREYVTSSQFYSTQELQQCLIVIANQVEWLYGLGKESSREEYEQRLGELTVLESVGLEREREVVRVKEGIDKLVELIAESKESKEKELMEFVKEGKVFVERVKTENRNVWESGRVESGEVGRVVDGIGRVLKEIKEKEAKEAREVKEKEDKAKEAKEAREVKEKEVKEKEVKEKEDKEKEDKAKEDKEKEENIVHKDL